MKEVKIDDHRNIYIIDDLFSFSEISGNYASAIEHKYSIYNSSDAEVQNLSDKRLGCPLEMDDNILSNVYSGERLEIFKKIIPQDQYTHWRSYINLGIHSDYHKIHVDDFSIGSGLTLLYYVNRNWNCDWGGETIFFDDQRKDIKYISSFIPGRILIFDSSIPHTATPQHFNAPPYRFTLASKFKRNN